MMKFLRIYWTFENIEKNQNMQCTLQCNFHSHIKSSVFVLVLPCNNFWSHIPLMLIKIPWKNINFSFNLFGLRSSVEVKLTVNSYLTVEQKAASPYYWRPGHVTIF